MKVVSIENWHIVNVDKIPHVRVWCPKCETSSLLDHEVSPDGDVTPSLVCDNCGWHNHASLDGWAEFPAVGYDARRPSREFTQTVAGHVRTRSFLDDVDKLNRLLGDDGVDDR